MKRTLATGLNWKIGYTLLESMIAVLIIGLLAAILAPSLQKARNDARDKQATIDTSLISGAVEQLAWDTSHWPGGEDISYTVVVGNELTDLNTTNAGLVLWGAQFDVNKWHGPYISNIEDDPWASKYFFDCDYELYPSNTVVTVIGSFGINKGTLNVYSDGDNIIDVIKSY